MPRFMDVHDNMRGLTTQAIAEAHTKDLAAQQKHGARFLSYWWDAKAGKVFCLSEAPNVDAVKRTHAEAGHPPNEVYEVQEGR